MTSAMSRSFARLLLVLGALVAVAVLSGCHQREPENPFVAPYGAALNSPFGG